MQLGKKGIVIIIIAAVAGGFAAGYLGSRVREIKEEKVPKAIAAVVEEPKYVEMEKLESTIKEQVEINFKPYKQKLDRWDRDKDVISTKLDWHGKTLEGLEEADDYFHGIVEEGTKWLQGVEGDVQKNQEEIEEVKKEIGPGDKYEIQMVYANPVLEPKFNLSAYNNKLYLDDLLYIVEEWHKVDINRFAIVERPYGKGKAVFFAGSDNRFGVEIVRSKQSIDKLLVLSSNNSIPNIDTISRTEAPTILKQLFAEYGKASLLPFKQALKKPAVALLFGEEPEVGRSKGKFYVR